MKVREEVRKKYRETLEKKIGYRFFKVLFVVALVLSFAVGLFVFFLNRPQSYVEDAIITCHDSKSFSAEEKGVYLYSDYVSDYDKEKIFKICNVGKKFKIRNKITDAIEEVSVGELERYGISLSNYAQEQFPKYKIEYRYKTEGNWNQAILFGLITISVLIIFVVVIKKTLLYIFIGGNWWKI